MLVTSTNPSNGLQIAPISRDKHSHRLHMQLRPRQILPTFAWSLGGRILLRWRGLLLGCLCRPPPRPALQSIYYCQFCNMRSVDSHCVVLNEYCD